MLINKVPTVPLREYLKEYLSKITLTNYMTGKTYTADKIMNWKKSYTLSILNPSEHIFAPSLKFATTSKYFGDTYELKTFKPQPIRKNVKIPYDVVYTEYITKTYKKKVYKTVIKKRKIGKHFYWTTEYIPTYKTYKKTVPVLTKGTAYEIKKKIVGYIQRKPEEILKYIYKFRLYLAFFLVERYIYKPLEYPVKLPKGNGVYYEKDRTRYELVHEVVIEPYFQQGQFPLHFGWQPFRHKNIMKVEFSTPQEMVDKGIINDVLEWAKFQLNSKRPPDNLKRLKDYYITDRHDLIDASFSEYISHYHYDEQILDLVFFTDYHQKEGNTKIEVVNDK